MQERRTENQEPRSERTEMSTTKWCRCDPLDNLDYDAAWQFPISFSTRWSMSNGSSNLEADQWEESGGFLVWECGASPGRWWP